MNAAGSSTTESWEIVSGSEADEAPKEEEPKKVTIIAAAVPKQAQSCKVRVSPHLFSPPAVVTAFVLSAVGQ